MTAEQAAQLIKLVDSIDTGLFVLAAIMVFGVVTR